jgi:hypothetical protein
MHSLRERPHPGSHSSRKYHLIDHQSSQIVSVNEYTSSEEMLKSYKKIRDRLRHPPKISKPPPPPPLPVRTYPTLPWSTPTVTELSIGRLRFEANSICALRNVTMSALLGRGGPERVRSARGEFYYTCLMTTVYSAAKIARFCDRHPSTVLEGAYHYARRNDLPLTANSERRTYRLLKLPDDVKHGLDVGGDGKKGLGDGNGIDA